MDVVTSVVSISVPEEHIGRVIGSKGAGLARLRQEAGVAVSVPRELVAPGMRCIEVQGTAEQVALAQQLVVTMQETAPPSLKRKANEDHVGLPAAAGRARLASYLPQAQLLHGFGGVDGAMLGLQAGDNPFPILGAAQTGDNPFSIMGAAQHAHALTGFPASLRPGHPLLPALMSHPPHSEAPLVARFLIDEKKVGAVVGKQGAVLKAIRESTGARMEVEREAVLSQRLVTIRAPLVAMRTSLEIVCDMLATGGHAAGLNLFGHAASLASFAMQHPFHIRPCNKRRRRSSSAAAARDPRCCARRVTGSTSPRLHRSLPRPNSHPRQPRPTSHCTSHCTADCTADWCAPPLPWQGHR